MPLIVLYGSNDYPHQHVIDTIIGNDCTNRPDLVMVMGTSLQVKGVQQLIQDLTGNASKVIFVNKEAPRAATTSLFTHHVQGETDDWADLILDCVNDVKELSPAPLMGAILDQPSLVDTSTHETAEGMFQGLTLSE